jgi:hypothetical protein
MLVFVFLLAVLDTSQPLVFVSLINTVPPLHAKATQVGREAGRIASWVLPPF